LTKYTIGSGATYAGVHYKALKANTGVVPPSDPTSWTEVKVPYTQPQGSANGVPFTIEPGMLLEIGGQVATVRNVDPVAKLFTVAFPMSSFSQSVGGQIICRGNPGPRQAYNPRRDSTVVLYMTMIQ
jgi:hypothetical protein